jgi:ornithine decarboxylase
LVHLESVQNRLRLWNAVLPNVKPFYAVKCNNLQPILETLKKGGAGFDCASSDEFYRVKGSEIIYANPCKARDELVKAKEADIKWCTFDTRNELDKIVNIIPDARPLLRIHVDDKGGSRIPLNRKFGMALKDAHTLHDCVRFYGIAFHVGSDCSSTESYKSAFETVRQFLEVLRENVGFCAHTLDIGGGFSGNSMNNRFFMEEVGPLVQEEIRKLPFKRVIAEPGRFFAEESCSLQVPIIGKKVLPDGTESITVDDSVYGIFSGVLFDGFVPRFKTDKTGPLKKYTIFGRTCDSADRIATDVELPECIGEGDILEIDSIGAYSYVSASEFNGFPRPSIQVLL